LEVIAIVQILQELIVDKPLLFLIAGYFGGQMLAYLFLFGMSFIRVKKRRMSDERQRFR
jgi:hypothetical protein